MKTSAKKMQVRINSRGSLQDFLDSRVRTADDDGQAIGPSENKGQLAQFEGTRSLRDCKNQEDPWGNLGQFVNKPKVAATPGIARRNLVRVFSVVIAHALGKGCSRLN